MAIISFCMLLAKYGKAQVFSIAGRVMDENSKPVAFASVVVYMQGDGLKKPVTGKITAEDGSFKLAVNNAGNYVIKVTYTSYADFTQEIQVASAISLEPIILRRRENQIAEVSITAKAPVIIKKADRIVMNVQNNAVAAGKSSLDLMNLAPGVFVNNGSISINGNPGTRVMVNGKLLQLSGNDLTSYLNSLRSDEIQSIEIIAHPPAEYDAEGSGGFINIILKKQKQAGFNGSVNLGYTQGRYANTNEGIQLNYKKNKLALFATYSFDKTKDYEDSKFSRIIEDSIHYNSSANRINDYKANRVHVGSIYDINSKQYIGLDYTGAFTNGSAPYNSTINIGYPNTVNNQIVGGSYPQSNSKKYNNIGLNYHIALDSVGSRFVFLFDYTHNDSKIFSSAQSNFYDNNSTFLGDTSFRNHTPSKAKIYTADAKYIKAFNKASALSLGAKYTSTRINNSATYEGFDNNTWVNAPDLNYIYDYKENIVAGYVNYNAKILNTDVQLGLRAENTNTEGILTTSDIDTRRNYFNLFPTIFLKHGVNRDNSNYITLYYGRRIERPSYNDLNPYEFYADNYTIARGNPFLTPSFTNSFELGYTLHNKYSITASYDKQDAMIAQYATQSPTDSLVTVYTHANFGKRTNASVALYAPISITDWWSSSNNISVRRERIAMPDLEIKKTIFSVQSNQSFTLPGQFSADVNAIYFSNILAGSFLLDHIFNLSAGIQKKLLKNSLTVKAAMNDIFNTNKFYGNVYYSNNNIGMMKQRRQTQTVNLSVIYNFDLGKSFKMKKIESSNAVERGRLQ